VFEDGVSEHFVKYRNRWDRLQRAVRREMGLGLESLIQCASHTQLRS
jgi:hypothetical protein